MSSPNPRKRPAPGSVPAAPTQSMPQMTQMGHIPTTMPTQPRTSQMPAPMNTMGTFDWNGNFDGTSFNNMANMFNGNANVFPNMNGQQVQNFQPQFQAPVQHQTQQQSFQQNLQNLGQPQVVQPQSFQDAPNLTPTNLNMVALREPRGAVVQARTQSTLPQNTGDYGPVVPKSLDFGPGSEHLDVEETNRLAELQFKKNPNLPPFVSKLNKWLREEDNTDLIDWSPDGKAIIIKNQDEFSSRMLPRMFKHNNFASFVRQLNMYGFHKHVAHGDNSLQSNAAKSQASHVYFNKYFQRDHLEWSRLITKTGKSAKKSKGKKKQQAEAIDASDDEDDVVDIEDDNDTQLAGESSNQLVQLPKTLAAAHRKIIALQQSQEALRGEIRAIHEENHQFRNQLQGTYERHEASINAILTFLANVFKQSVEGGDPNGMREFVNNMMANIGVAQGPQGHVINLDNANQRHTPGSQNTPRRAQHLLPAPPSASQPATGSRTIPASAQSNSSNHYQPGYQQGSMGAVVEELVETPPDSSTTSDLRTQLRQNAPQGMMNFINNANARTPTTPRSAVSRTRPVSPITFTPSSALATPPPTMFTPSNGVSHDIPGIPPAMPNFDIPQTQTGANVQNMQRENDAHIQDLSAQLGPLSPNGHIPGLEDDFFNSATANDEFDQFFDGLGDGDNPDLSSFDASHPEFLDGASLETPVANTPAVKMENINDFTNGGNTSHQNVPRSQDFAQHQDRPQSFDWLPVNHPRTVEDVIRDAPLGQVVTPEKAQRVLNSMHETAWRNHVNNSVREQSQGNGDDTPSPTGTEEIERDDLDSPGRSAKRRRVA